MPRCCIRLYALRAIGVGTESAHYDATASSFLCLCPLGERKPTGQYVLTARLRRNFSVADRVAAFDFVYPPLLALLWHWFSNR